MTLSKFTQQPTNKEVVDKINDVIDTMGSTSGANIDLSNLSATGEEKIKDIFVAEYGTTTYADIKGAYNSGKTIICKYTPDTVLYYYLQLEAYTGATFTFSTVDTTNPQNFYTTINSNNTWNIGGTNLADADLSNLSATGKEVLDGQWVVLDPGATANKILDGASLKNSSNQDVSKTVVLPNDGHKYEVMLRGTITTGSTSGNYIKLQFHSTSFADTVFCCSARTRSASTVTAMGTVIIPMTYGSNNLLISRDADFNGTAILTAIAYRRIGTNT